MGRSSQFRTEIRQICNPSGLVSHKCGNARGDIVVDRKAPKAVEQLRIGEQRSLIQLVLGKNEEDPTLELCKCLGDTQLAGNFGVRETGGRLHLQQELSAVIQLYEEIRDDIRTVLFAGSGRSGCGGEEFNLGTI